MAWDGGKLWGIDSSLSLFLPVRSTDSLICAGSIDVDLNSEKGVIAREEGPFLSVKVARTRAVGHLRCESGPHLHEVVTGRRGGEAKLPLAVEVEFTDEMESCVSAGWTLWRSSGGHSWMVNQRINVGTEVFSCRSGGLALIYMASEWPRRAVPAFMKFPRVPISHLIVRDFFDSWATRFGRTKPYTIEVEAPTIDLLYSIEGASLLYHRVDGKRRSNPILSGPE